MKPRVIAFYLPQFHPFPENDKWWGKGFTEWTSVGKAKPLFKGHYQPKVPADLGYYDLRVPEVREQQAELAREAGIEGFCYWHYWFGNGKRLMADVFDEVLKTGKPDYPFCLGWANHSWYAKNWNKDATKGADKMLIEQKYFGETDFRMHYDYVVKAFKDKRYIKQGKKPVFLIFDPATLPKEFIPLWQKWAKEDGFEDGIYFVAQIKEDKNYEEILKLGFDAVTPNHNYRMYLRFKQSSLLKKIFVKLFWIIANPIKKRDYKEAISDLVNPVMDVDEHVVPFLLPNWDHTPRSGKAGMILHNSTPEAFRILVKKVFSIVSKKQNKLVFLKSWNEWGEGNYMEPDLRFGKGYINVLGNEIKNKQL